MFFEILAFILIGLVWFVAIIKTFKSEAEEEEEKRKGDKKENDE